MNGVQGMNSVQKSGRCSAAERCSDAGRDSSCYAWLLLCYTYRMDLNALLEQLVVADSGISFDASTFRQLTGPIVYAFIRDGVPVYIGMSRHGIGRPSAPMHHKMGSRRGKGAVQYDSVFIWSCPDRDAAVTLERLLIERLRPAHNQRVLSNARTNAVAELLGIGHERLHSARYRT